MDNGFTLSVDSIRCIKCGLCVRVCPAHIFYMKSKDQVPSTQNEQACIRCGHCVAVCPTDAVEHSDFPESKVHRIDRQELPSPESLMLLMRSRRSNRGFSESPVPDHLLETIVEAAHRAPTASNSQTVGFTVVTSPEKLRAVSQFTIDTFSGVASRLENPFIKPVLKPLLRDVYKMLPNFRSLTEQYDKGNDMILRGAKAIIFIHTTSKRFGEADANLAYQNGSLMAESLGVNQFYTGFVCAAVNQKKGELEKMFGIDGRIYAGMALGMPSFTFPKYIDRKDIKVRKL